MEALWIRGAALQLSHNQESVDFLAVAYTGKLEEPFDRTKLIGIEFRLKLVADAAANVLHTVRPFGIRRGGPDPAPYLVIYLDLGSDSIIAASKSLVHLEAWSPPDPKEPGFWTYLELETERDDIQLAIDETRDKDEKKRLKKLAGEVEAKMDAWGCYGIHVRGCKSTTYGLLGRSEELKIEFETFMSLCTPQPDAWGSYAQHMQPFVHLGVKKAHKAFMNRFNPFQAQDLMDVNSV
jgi:hypothetical protein